MLSAFLLVQTLTWWLVVREERARNKPVIQTAKEWPTLPWRYAALLQQERGEKRDDGRPRCREGQHRHAHKPALRIGKKRPQRRFL